jgi:hypothetical protein
MCKKLCQKGIQMEGYFKQKIVPIIYIKGSIMKNPCMAMCKATNRKVIRDEVWERGEVPERGGGGGGERYEKGGLFL